MLNAHFVYVGVVLNLCGTASYVVQTVRGKTRPNRVTWLLWAIAPSIAFFAELTQHVGIQSLMTASIGFGPFLVFIASFIGRNAVWQIQKRDYVCGGLSCVALIAWKVSGNGDLAILLSICADVLAGVPTLIKAYTHPHSESPTAFLLAAVSAGITLLTIRKLTVSSCAFPMYIVVLGSLIGGMVVIRGRIIRTKESRHEHEKIG